MRNPNLFKVEIVQQEQLKQEHLKQQKCKQIETDILICLNDIRGPIKQQISKAKGVEQQQWKKHKENNNIRKTNPTLHSAILEHKSYIRIKERIESSLSPTAKKIKKTRERLDGLTEKLGKSNLLQKQIEKKQAELLFDLKNMFHELSKKQLLPALLSISKNLWYLGKQLSSLHKSKEIQSLFLIAEPIINGRFDIFGSTNNTANIFISYRRDDGMDISARIYESLCREFGKKTVFRDIESITPGMEFNSRIENKILESKYFLPIITKNWNPISGDSFKLFNEDDWIRKELRIAINNYKTIIPALTQGCRHLTAQEIPEDISLISELEPIEISSDERYVYDTMRLIDHIKQYEKQL